MTSLYFQGRPVCIDCDRQREGPDKTVPMKKPSVSAAYEELKKAGRWRFGTHL